MDRRGFIGSVIGTAAGAAFFARLPMQPWQRVIKPYRMAFRDSKSGFTIQAPGILSIEKLENGYRFIAEQLNVSKSMELDQALLLKPNGQLIRKSNYHSRVHMMAGDALKVTYDLTVDALIKVDVDTLTNLFIKYKDKIPKELIYGC